MKLKKVISFILAFAMILTYTSITSIVDPANAEVDTTDYLTFTSDKAFTVKLTKGSQCAANYALQYSTNKEDSKSWNDWTGIQDSSGNTVYTATAANSGGKYVIYLRGSGNTRFASNSMDSSCSTFSFAGIGEEADTPEIKASGNIMTLLDYQNPDKAEMGAYAFARMFLKCKSLTEAPKLPATTLTMRCYHNMFASCTSLTEAPELPAEKLETSCYYAMFFKCKSLTKAPDLPATTLANSCYNMMFYGCTSLTEAPKLEVTTLADNCYSQMFYGCTHLYITKLDDNINNKAKWIIPSSTVTNPTDQMTVGTAAGSSDIEPPTEGTNYYKVEPAYDLNSVSSLGDETGGVTFKVGEYDADTAAKGKEVTVSAKEVSGYNVSLSGVYGENSTKLDISEDGKFTMPEEAVTVTATYISQHNFTYSSNDNKIVATCGDAECTLEGKAVSIGIDAEDAEYDESPYDDASIEGKDAWVAAGLTAPSIKYYKYNSETTQYDLLDSAPTNVGEYKAEITVDAFTISDTFEITRTEGSGTVSIEGWTYGDDAKIPSLNDNTNKGADVTYKYAPKGEAGTDYSTIATSDVPSKAGDYVVIATVAAAGNYDEYTTEPCQFTVSPKNITVTTKNASKKYGEEDPSFELDIPAGSLVGEDTLSGTFSREEGTDVKEGGYTITYTPEEGKNPNYNITVNNTGKLTINKADNAITEFKCDDTDLENDPKPSAKSASGDDVTFTYSTSETGNFDEWDTVNTGVGTYYVKATSSETSNYNSKEEVKSFKVGYGCKYEKESEPENGTFNLKLGDREYGKVKLTQSGKGWAIYSEDAQKYIYWDGSEVKYSDNAYVWNYNKGFYVTKSTETKILFWTFTKKKNYYLSFDGSELSAATNVVTAVLTKEVSNSSHSYDYRYNGDGTHTYYCTECEKEFGTDSCEYGENGLCKYCGHLNPSCVSFDVDVTVTSKTTKASGWARFFSRNSRTTYTANIDAKCTGDELKSVEYSVDNVNYKEGMTYSNSSEITTLYIRVTAANGASKTFLYQDGEVTPVGQPE